MSPAPGIPPIRVERALNLLPDIDALVPLRAFLISVSRGARSPTEPDRTVGKRYIRATELRDFIPRAVGRLAEHLGALYESAVDALESEERGDLNGSVRALLAAGEREERAGRAGQAWVWYDHALRIAEELRDRRPEIQALRQLGALDAARGAYETAARFYQRSFTLAEAALDCPSAALACRGLGQVAAAQSRWPGAASWYARGLKYAQDDSALAADLLLAMANVARHRGEREGAEEWLRQARRQFEKLGQAEGLARVLIMWGEIDASTGRHVQALARYREALSQLEPNPSPELEMAIRHNLAELHLAWDRLPAAEDEIRRAEELAIAHGLTRQLAKLYIVLGKVRARQDDEGGFVFFEKAIELCRGREPAPRLEATVYIEYARFRRKLGDLEECRAYLGRARELLEAEGDTDTAAWVDAELAEAGEQQA